MSKADAPNPWLCAHDELPAWAMDNEYIVSGHRRPGGAAMEARKLAKGKSKSIDAGYGDDAEVVKASARALRTTRSRAKMAPEAEGQDESAQEVNGNGHAILDSLDSLEEYEHNTYAKCWNSVWSYWHNETVNIHTHLWGALFSVGLAFLHVVHLFGLFPESLHYLAHHPIFSPSPLPAPSCASIPHSQKAQSLSGKLASLIIRPPVEPVRPAGLSDLLSFSVPLHSHQIQAAWSRPPNAIDIAGFACFFTGAVLCLTFSSSFHCFQSHSKDVAKRCNKLDYVGIVVMICGSFVPALHYGFHCHPHIQLAYTIGVLALGGLAVFFVVNPTYATPAYRPIRTAIFLALGLSAIFPTTHVVLIYGHENVAKMMGLHYLVLSGALYVVGALLYACRVPERFAPGKFDYIGASHQIFHFFILGAAFAHYISLRRGYAFWHAVEALSGDKSSAAVCAALETWRKFK